jgi:dephospho-CoA kinase
LSSGSFIVYFDISYDIRRKRLMDRGDIDSVDRRLNADESDFKEFIDFDYSISDPNFKIEGDWTDLSKYSVDL